MKWTGRTARRAPRAAARIAALAGMVAATGLAAGAASASGSHATALQTATVSLTYQCRFPSGSRPVTAGVTASLPTVANTGKPIRPAGVSLTMTLPPPAVAALAGLHAATVSAATRLTVSESEGPTGIMSVWAGGTARPVRRPAHGSLTLTAKGAVPPVTASSPGEVALTAAGLSVTFTGGSTATPAPGPNRSAGAAPDKRVAAGPAATPDPGGQATPAPSAAAPSVLQVTCALAPGQHAVLGTVLINGTARRTAQRHAAVTTGKCPPHGKLKLNPLFPHPKPPKSAKRLNATPVDGCAWVAGYSDVRKLNGAAFVGPALSDVATNVLVWFRPPNPAKHDNGYIQLDNVLQLEDNGKHEFPPATATFLSFGFVPTSATMHILEIGTINAFSVGVAASCNTCQQTTTVYTRARVLIDHVRVNGVPLDVGSSCETPPFNIVVQGSILSKPPYTPSAGGPLSGEVTIPRFKNCGVGEHLEPIFDAAISGKGNFSLLTQGVECTVPNAFGCNPKTGRPEKPKVILRKVIG